MHISQKSMKSKVALSETNASVVVFDYNALPTELVLSMFVWIKIGNRALCHSLTA